MISGADSTGPVGSGAGTGVVTLTGACGICAAGAAAVDAAASVGGAGLASRVGAPSGGASSGLLAGPTEGAVVEVAAASEVGTTGAVTTAPAEGAASFPFTNVPGTTAGSTGPGALGPAPGGVSKKSAIPAVATIAVAAKPRGRPNERRDVLSWRLHFEALAVRIGLGGVCCFGLSGGVGEVSPPVSGAVSWPGRNLKTFASASSGVIHTA